MLQVKGLRDTRMLRTAGSQNGRSMGAEGAQAGDPSGVSREQTAIEPLRLYEVLGLHPSGKGEGEQTGAVAKGL